MSLVTELSQALEVENYDKAKHMVKLIDGLGASIDLTENTAAIYIFDEENCRGFFAKGDQLVRVTKFLAEEGLLST